MSHLARHPRTAPGPVARETAMKWGRSLLDFQFHAVDEMADHPRGVYRAECGRTLLAVTILRDTPIGATCEACVARTRPLDHLWRALPGEPLCAHGAVRRCVLVAGHGVEIEHTARDGAAWGV